MRSRFPALIVLLAGTLGVTLGACGSDDNGGTSERPPPDAPTITIEDFDFSQLTVDAGEKVYAVNEDSAPHDVTEVDEEFGSGEIGGNKVGTFTAPDKPGTYQIFCTIHPSMKGKLTVR
jgi:plastocyanin